MRESIPCSHFQGHLKHVLLVKSRPITLALYRRKLQLVYKDLRIWVFRTTFDHSWVSLTRAEIAYKQAIPSLVSTSKPASEAGLLNEPLGFSTATF